MSKSDFTSRKDLPEVLPTEKTFFCVICGATPVTKVKYENGTSFYHCDACGKESERFIAWDPGMEQYFNDNNELVHGSVGVIVQNTKKEILLFKRVKYPFLWTIPAGHVDQGEDKVHAARRELAEETKIESSHLRLVFSGEIRGDSCVGGSDIHFWHTYLCEVPVDTRPTIEAEEGREWGWFPLSGLPEVTMPVEYILKQPSVVRSLDFGT